LAIGYRCVVLIPLLALLACNSPAPAALACHFVPIQSAADELRECATERSDGSLQLRPGALAAVAGRESQPVSIVIASILYYVNSQGRIAPVLWHDNGADYFKEGLARTHRDGKVGFIDRELVERIPPIWDFAFPFRTGFAIVCPGCRSVPDGEHRAVRGGLWGYIDREGVEVVPLEFERDQLPLPPLQ
jgi:hypothetical protein